MIKIGIRFLYLCIIATIILCISYLPNYSSRPENSPSHLNIFVWGDFFPEETFRKFEDETKIKVHVNYYTSNEELILKLEKTGGAGYDLIFPSDYAITSLQQKGLIKPLNKEKLPFFDRIEPSILDCTFDPTNQFSIPYFWEVYGLTFETKKVPLAFQPTLAALFQGNHKVIMTQDPVESVCFASHYLHGPKERLSPQEIQSVLQLLKTQKQSVELYTDHRAHHVISSEDAPVAIIRSSFFFKNLENLPHLEFYPPKGGTFVTIENVAISIASAHLEEAYAFINFIYRPEIMAIQIDEGPLFPACRDCLPFTTIPLGPRYYKLLDNIQKEPLYFFSEQLVSSEEVRPLWVEVQF